MIKIGGRLINGIFDCHGDCIRIGLKVRRKGKMRKNRKVRIGNLYALENINYNTITSNN